ncbi:MAG: cyclic pyranopterin monophosphate synthase MoaC [Methanosarcinales archaeon]|nr:cyclic pyranopterin monophosphate synthase MoaC [Methanosarcinales archaeon]
MATQFSHIHDGRARMVDISDKCTLQRMATTSGRIVLSSDTIARIVDGTVEKGNVLATARIAAIMAAKKTPDIIPMCHQIPVTSCDVEFDISEQHITSTVTVKSVGSTGVEMEALHAVCVSLLTIWDMVKSAEKDVDGNYPDTVIENVKVIEKIKRG